MTDNIILTTFEETQDEIADTKPVSQEKPKRGKGSGRSRAKKLDKIEDTEIQVSVTEEIPESVPEAVATPDDSIEETIQDETPLPIEVEKLEETKPDQSEKVLNKEKVKSFSKKPALSDFVRWRRLGRR